MTGLKLFLIFLAVLIIDGLLLPAFFDFKNSLLSLLVLIVAILYLGPKARYIIYGVFFSAISEIFRGFNFGALSLPFLLTVVVIYLAQMFLDIKYTYDTRFNLGKLVLLASVSTAFSYLFLTFYKWGGVNEYYFNSIIGLTIILESLILVFVCKIVFNNKSDYS